LQDVGKGEWNVPRLRELLLNVLPRDHHVRDFRMETEIPHVGKRTLLINARRLPAVEGDVPLILLSIEEGAAAVEGEVKGGESAWSAVRPHGGKKKAPR
jgi:two-component system CheB/CheR fusion protein